jgi:hypothetical protein
MSWTRWHRPRSINYWTDSGIEFTDGDSVLDPSNTIISQSYLTGIATSGFNLGGVNQVSSRGLIFSDFGFTQVPVEELELMIVCDRYARIVDERVQLYNQQPLGINVADTSSDNQKVYSGAVSSFWRTPILSVGDPAFGVLLDFAPRPDMPSSNPLIIRSVSIRVR